MKLQLAKNNVLLSASCPGHPHIWYIRDATHIAISDLKTLEYLYPLCRTFVSLLSDSEDSDNVDEPVIQRAIEASIQTAEVRTFAYTCILPLSP